MYGTPSLHAPDVHRAYEVTPVLGFGQPRRLAALLARRQAAAEQYRWRPALRGSGKNKS